MPREDLIQVRGGTHAEWNAENPVLEVREIGVAIDDPPTMKAGDGVTAWADLAPIGDGSGGPPSGPAGGALGGTYPNPSFAVDMATQAEADAITSALTAHINDATDAHDASAISFSPSGLIVATDVQAALVELDLEKAALAGAAFTGASPVTAKSVTGDMLITLPSGAVNGLMIQSVATNSAYAQGLALAIFGNGNGNANDQSSAGPLMAKIDPDGNIGTVGVLHVAAGARGRWGMAPTYGIQIQPTPVGVNLLELAPPGSATGRAIKLYAPGTGSERWYLDPAGITVGLADDFVSASYYISSASAGFGTVRALFQAINAATIPLYLKAAASQTADIFEAVDSSAVILTRINKGGYLMTRKSAAPADGDVATGEISWWFDTTNGSPKIMWKGKQANGTVVTGGILLNGTTVFQASDADLTDLIARWIAASAAGPASLDFAEDTDNGANRVRLTAPAALSGDFTVTLPSATGTLVNTDQVFAQAQAVNAQTDTTYTLVAGDAGKLVTLDNAGAITLTVPQDSDATIAVGTYVDLMQLGAGQVTVAAGSGATLRVSGLTAKARAQYSRLSLQKVSANTWSLMGDLAAA